MTDAPPEPPKDTNGTPPEPKPDMGTTDKVAEPAGEPGEEKWPRTATEWKKFKEARKERETQLTGELDLTRKQIKEMEAKLASASNSVDPKELDVLKKERDELSERLRLTAVERHPDFQRHFDSKINAQLELAKRIVGPEKADAAIRLLKSEDGAWKDQQIEELVADLPPLKQSQIGGVLNALAEINTNKAGVLSNAKEHYDKLMGEQKAQEKQRVATFQKAFSDALTKAQDPKDGIVVFQKREGDEAWNQGVEQRIKAATELLSGQPNPGQIVEAALNAVSFSAVLEHAKAIHTENQTLRAQIAELSKASPKIEGKQPEAGNDGETKKIQFNSSMNPMEASREFFKALQGDYRKP